MKLVGCQVHSIDGRENNGTLICTRFLEKITTNYLHKSIMNVVMFDGALNVQLSSELLKKNYPKISVMCGVEHTVSIFFNYFFKIPVMNQIITYHKAIYKLFGYCIYHKPQSKFKSESYEFQNRKISLCSGNDARMAGYFVGIHR